MSKVIKLGDYRGIEVKVPKQLSVTEEEINREIQNFLSQNSQLVEKDGEVANGDVTTIDFEGFKDGVPFEGGKANGHQLEIGSGQFIPGFEEQMIGMTKGETRDLNLTFPENYGVADLAGADVVFKVTVNKIATKKEAELTDEFIASLNAPNFKTVEELKNLIETSLQMQYKQQFEAAKENAVLGKLIGECEVEVSDEDVEKALQQHIQHISIELAQQGLQLEQYLQMMNTDLDSLKQQILPTAKQQASFEAIIDEIVKVESLTTSDEEAKDQVSKIAAANQMSVDEVLEKIQLDDLKRDLARIQASHLIMDLANIIEE
ncbi:trigger factor [Erysipelatoclostridium sp. An15]|uniref:peptidylprolyl isomerase n=1 Tax=Candidatus Erysipelatoclostridium merdavium TaxID=2838566 RepID=A0A9D1XJX4_9FIRM|nr:MULTISPECIES: trigger factor [unclassified Thomasclavelia]OUP73099.1 trigger factor [Erysipelatoclostridium sp. An173]OUQ07567.1 trigger factor [Erysipelatoclostridium sp. An15]HIX80580.1 trigger factor [Candidatus Erysipelatoclostridium merdavium]